MRYWIGLLISFVVTPLLAFQVADFAGAQAGNEMIGAFVGLAFLAAGLSGGASIAATENKEYSEDD